MKAVMSRRLRKILSQAESGEKLGDVLASGESQTTIDTSDGKRYRVVRMGFSGHPPSESVEGAS